MKAEVKDCGRESELIDFIYRELDRGKTESFQRHLLECSECHAEIESLKEVRESVVLWRNESLGGATSASGVVNSSGAIRNERSPSALAALRQFFNLSPLWMKGAVVFASLLFCLFAGLAVGRLRQTPSAPVTTNGGSKEYSQRELQALVDRRVQDELQRIKNSVETAPASPDVVKNAPNRNPTGRLGDRQIVVAGGIPFQKARRPLTKTEREQLAADLRLVSAKSDSELDLLEDRINQ